MCRGVVLYHDIMRHSLLYSSQRSNLFYCVTWHSQISSVQLMQDSVGLWWSRSFHLVRDRVWLSHSHGHVDESHCRPEVPLLCLLILLTPHAVSSFSRPSTGA